MSDELFIELVEQVQELEVTLVEVALVTANGMKWLASGKGDLSQFNSAAGDFLFMGSGWRLRRASSGDANATLQAFAQSTDGTPVDEVNGPVRYLTSDSPTAIAAAVRAELATELARLDAAISSRSTQTSVDKAVSNSALAAALSA